MKQLICKHFIYIYIYITKYIVGVGKFLSNFAQSVDSYSVKSFSCISLIYCVNNYLTYYLMQYIDPATVALFKSFAPGMYTYKHDIYRKVKSFLFFKEIITYQ